MWGWRLALRLYGGKNTNLLRLAPLRREHDAGVVRQHVQPLLLGQKLIGTLLDTSQMGEVQLQKLDPPLAASIRIGSFLDRFDCGVGLFGAATGDVDGCVLGVQDFHQLQANA